jgi:L-rhamnose mutarotase
VAVRIALHTRVRADRIAEYEAAHRAVPAELTAAIRSAGAKSWTIWRSGTDLFHVIECADYPALLADLSAQPVNTAWQARMAELLDVAHDYSASGANAALPVVWEL